MSGRFAPPHTIEDKPVRLRADAKTRQCAPDLAGLGEPGALDGGRLLRWSEGVLFVPNTLVPGQCDPTVGLHDWLTGVRGPHCEAATVESIRTTEARGGVH